MLADALLSVSAVALVLAPLCVLQAQALGDAARLQRRARVLLLAAGTADRLRATPREAWPERLTEAEQALSALTGGRARVRVSGPPGANLIFEWREAGLHQYMAWPAHPG